MTREKEDSGSHKRRRVGGFEEYECGAGRSGGGEDAGRVVRVGDGSPIVAARIGYGSEVKRMEPTGR